MRKGMGERGQEKGDRGKGTGEGGPETGDWRQGTGNSDRRKNTA